MFARITSLLSRLNLHLHASRQGPTFQAWLRGGERHEPIASLETTVGGFHLGATVSLVDDCEGGVRASIGLGPVRIFLGSEHSAALALARRLAPYMGKDWYGHSRAKIGAELYAVDGDYIARLYIGGNDEASTGPTHYYNLKDIVLGRSKYSTEAGSPVVRTVNFAEGPYALRITPEVSTWKRPRWPFPVTSRRFEWSVLAGTAGRSSIPVPGKGENDYDLDEDGVSGGCMPARDPEQVCGEIVGDILRTRLQRGGASWVPETPIDPAGAGGPNQAMSA